MSWRVARSLDTLLLQLNRRYPARSKASDGSIGDAAHSARRSDHNPDSGRVVRARDFTHDPRTGPDIARLAEDLRASRDSRVKYVIWNRQIMSGASGPSPWVARKYSGANPHTSHLHLSVVAGAAGDDPRTWNLSSLGGGGGGSGGGGGATRPTPAAGGHTLRRGSSGERVSQLQRVLAAWYPTLRLTADGAFGPATEAAVRHLQSRAGLVVDGIAGPKTLSLLGL